MLQTSQKNLVPLMLLLLPLPPTQAYRLVPVLSHTKLYFLRDEGKPTICQVCLHGSWKVNPRLLLVGGVFLS